MFLLGLFTYPALVNTFAQRILSWPVSLGIAALLGPTAAVLAALALLLDPSIEKGAETNLNGMEAR